MQTSKAFATVAALLTTTGVSSKAADMDGAWASDATVCSNVFVKKDNKVSLAPDSELYGGGLIIEGNRVIGSFQKCNIKSLKREGETVHLIASCSTGVMVSDLQVTIKRVGDNQMTLSPAGPVDTTSSYVRCPL
jgi:hypothetical protein